MTTAAPGAGARTSENVTAIELLRSENQLRVEQIRAHRLARAEAREKRRRDLTESLSLDWVTPYAELLDLARSTNDPIVGGPTSYWQRRGGRNWPVYQTEAELNLLRAPARLLLAVNGYAQGLVEGLTSYVVGSGCTYRMGKVSDKDDTPQEVIDAAQRIVDQILERAQWFGGEQPGIEEELFGRSIEDGEWLLAHYPQEDGACEFRVQEPEQLTQPPGSGPEYTFGILTPVNDAAKHERYYLQWGETPEQGEEHDADEVTHYRRNVRRNMKRGVTDFCFDTYDSLNLASRLRTNLGDTAAQQASIVAVRQWQDASEEELQRFNDDDADFTKSEPLTGGQERIKVRKRGSWEDVPKGMAYVPGPIASSTPIHIQVLDACLRGAGQKWQAPPWLMSGDLNAMNYATSLTAESPFVKTIQRRQRGYTEAFRRPIWFALRHWIRTRGLRDRTGKVWSWEEVEHRLKLTVTAPNPETRNKGEEAQRASIEIPLGVQSRQGYMQEQGRDADRIEADNKEWADKNQTPTGAPLPTDVPPDGGSGGGGAGARTSDEFALPESLLESCETPESVTGEELLDLLGSGRVLLEARDGLTAKKISVTRNGKTYETTVWVKTDTAQGAKRRPAADRDVFAALKEPGRLSDDDVKALAGRLKDLPKERLRQISMAFRERIGGTKADLADRLLDRVRAKRGGNDGRSGTTDGANAGDRGPVAPAVGRSGDEGDGGQRVGADKPAGGATDGTVPATVAEVHQRIERYQKLFRNKGRHEIADWLGQLHAHVSAVGDGGLAQVVASLGPSKASEKSANYDAANPKLMGEFVRSYLAQFGITAVNAPRTADQNQTFVSPRPQGVGWGFSRPKTPAGKKAGKGDFAPDNPKLRDKLQQSKALPGLESSADLDELTGSRVTHLTPDVVSKLDEKYGASKWIVKPYGEGESQAGHGIFFPQRAAQLRTEARATMHDASEHLGRYGFKLRRDEGGRAVGLEHAGGDRYDFGSEAYNRTIDGDARHWADRAAAAADHENGPALPGEGRKFMAQPAFDVVGVSERDRAKGTTIAPGEARVHIVTRNGKAQAVPYATWIKGDHLPVVFETDDTRAMAKAAEDAINAMPKSERQGHMYAPDVVKTSDGYRVVETNASGLGAVSGYLLNNPLVIDSYVSHVTGREPGHVQFIRRLLTKQKGAKA